MHDYQQMTLWAHFAIVSLGLWLIASPFTLGYLDLDAQSVARSVLRVGAERDLLPL